MNHLLTPEIMKFIIKSGMLERGSSLEIKSLQQTNRQTLGNSKEDVSIISEGTCKKIAGKKLVK